LEVTPGQPAAHPGTFVGIAASILTISIRREKIIKQIQIAQWLTIFWTECTLTYNGLTGTVDIYIDKAAMGGGSR
jgi:hypothetical protein